MIETWRPFPIQPVVLRSGFHQELKDHLRAALLAIGTDPRTLSALADFGLERFAPVTYEDYVPEEQALQRCESVLRYRPR